MKVHINQLSRLIDAAIASLSMSPTNDKELGELAFNLFIGQVLEGKAKLFLKSKDKLKAVFSEKLSAPCEEFDLLVTTDVTVRAKVTAPRESFDLSAFVKTVGDKYEIPVSELMAIAAVSVKQSAAPVSFSTGLNK